MPAFSMNNPIVLILAVAVLWFFARFVLGRKGGVRGLGSMFRREAPTVLKGVGSEALKTLIDDTRKLVGAEAGLRGIVLAGPFAAKAADGHSTATLIIPAEHPVSYSGDGWLAKWPYIARGHAVQAHEIVVGAGDVEHRFTLRGAPKLIVHFVSSAAQDAPPALRAVIGVGTQTLDDPTGQVDKLRRHWVDKIDQPSGDQQ